MWAKMHLNLLILCIVSFQSIIGTISSENISKPSDLLVRNKRVLNFEEGGDVPVRPGDYPYVVNIELRNVVHCVGSIISPLTIITASFCATEHITAYKILTGSIYTFRGSVRYVVEKKIRHGNYVGTRALDGIALFIVDEQMITRYTGIANFHQGPIMPGVHAGTIIGWGCYYESRERGTKHPRVLRSIAVPTISHDQCQDAYRGIYVINPHEDICTYHQHKHCGNTDYGAPLIIDGKITGVYLRKGIVPLHLDPEIFADLRNPQYKVWIDANIVHVHPAQHLLHA